MPSCHSLMGTRSDQPMESTDFVIKDFTEKGFSVSQGGTWGESGKPGSGRYEYIDMENAGGVTVELLKWHNFGKMQKFIFSLSAVSSMVTPFLTLNYFYL